MIMLYVKECGIVSSSGAAAGRRSCASSSRVVQAPTSSLQMEDTSGVHFTNEFQDMFHWQSQFCEINITDHTNIHSMLDELQADDVILQPDGIIIAAAAAAAAADPTIPHIDSMRSSTCLTIPQVMMNSDSICNIPMVVSSEPVGMIEMATATDQQAAAAAPFADSEVVGSISSRPVIAIPASSGDPTSPSPTAAGNFTPPSVPTPMGSEIRCRREFSVTPDNINDVSECRPNPKVSPKSKKTSRARASPPVKNPKVIKEAPVRGNLHPKEVRSPTQADHIIRERQRRDDMAAKYNVLEALLPPAIKRERAAVVEDAKELVKNLQHRKTELLKRRSQMRLTTSSRGQRGGLPGGSIRHNLKMNAAGGVHNVPTATVMVPHHQQSVQEISGSQVSSSMASPALECIIKPVMMDHHQVNEATAATTTTTTATRKKNLSSSSDFDHDDHCKVDSTKAAAAATCIKALHINARHAAEGEELVVEMVCSWCRPNFHSLLIQTVESLSFEVIGCNICRLPATGFVQCLITAKPQIGQQKNTEIPLSSRIVGALQSAFDQI